MSFERAIEFVLDIEGEHDAHDPVGGDTWWGISRAAFPDLAPWPPSKETAIGIYRRLYWDANRCGELPQALGMVVFDMGVNQGIKPAARTLQKVLRVTQDGIIGPATLAAARAADVPETVARFLAARAIRYTSTRGFDRNGMGWLTRCFLVQQVCLSLHEENNQ